MKNSIYACMHLQKQIHVSIIYIHAHSFSSRMIALKKKIFSSEPLWAWPCCLMQNQRFPPVLWSVVMADGHVAAGVNLCGRGRNTVSVISAGTYVIGVVGCGPFVGVAVMQNQWFPPECDWLHWLTVMGLWTFVGVVVMQNQWLVSMVSPAVNLWRRGHDAKWFMDASSFSDWCCGESSGSGL